MQELPFYPSVISGLIIAVISLITAFIAARIAGAYQVKVANINASRDIQIQRDRIWEERSRAALAAHLERLQALHITLSEINLENSLTMSYIQSDANMELSVFRERYLINCEKLHNAQAMVGVFYADMAYKLGKIYGLTNVFWGHQEHLLRIDVSKNPDPKVRRYVLSEVIETANELANPIFDLKNLISDRAKEIQKEFQRPFQEA